ncbi:MAG: tRNA pseudouridine(55) synthase TruB [Methylococcales bacterium]|nr:tRNA pseudouridine(55) synthase TruB [Methylococcales bacterium]
MDRAMSKYRNIQGIVLLDKPLHLSSNDALQVVKRLFNAKKAGHTGSLDPLASGLLVICFGEATKVTSFLLDATKRYVVRAKLGQKTETADAEGAVISERPVEAYTEAKIAEVVKSFTGELQQIPPMYSALKHKGERLYRLARQGIEVERPPRYLTIYKLTVLDRTEDTIQLDVTCSKGTYIRTLVEDIGEALGCGAHTIELHRVGVGPFQDESQFHTLDDLRGMRERDESLDSLLLPMELALADLPKVDLSSDMAFYMKQGQPVQIANAPTAGLVRMFGVDEFIGVGKILSDGRVAPKRLLRT